MNVVRRSISDRIRRGSSTPPTTLYVQINPSLNTLDIRHSTWIYVRAHIDCLTWDVPYTEGFVPKTNNHFWP